MNKWEYGVGSNLVKADGEIVIKLRQALEQKGLTRYRFSKDTGIRYDTICNYCDNKVLLINKEYLRIFCHELDCELSDIIEYNKAKD